MLNASFTPPTSFNNGFGFGLFLAPSIEYYKPGTRLGFQLQAGYDSRVGQFNRATTPCNCPADLDAKLTYITIEPNIRFAPFKSNFYLFGGPRFAFNQDKSFTYSQKTNPNFPLQVQNPDVKGDFSAINENLISMQIGMGFDFPLNATNSKTQFVASPFISYHPYFGQNPRSADTWTVSTVRVGFILKFGQGRMKETPIPVDGEVQFTIEPPTNTGYVETVREVFPIRNYVFFDDGSTNIPARYVVLNKSEVKNFKEDQVELNTPNNMSGRAERQMLVYYNVLNILGDRMVKNPNTSITLIGSSEKGEEEGLMMAQNIKTYLVTTFDIAESRIKVEGREKPFIQSVKVGGTSQLELLEAGNRRVSIETNSPELLMEFQSGKEATLKPVEIYTSNQNSDDVVFNVAGSEEVFASWTLQVKSKEGMTQNFGPFSDENISIPKKSIMGNQPAGDFNITMNGTTKTGNNVTKETVIYLSPTFAPEVQESLRFSVLYEYDESKSISIYEKYLTEIVTPKIPVNGMVIITGYTDIIGDMDYNKILSLARANDVKSILEKSLAAAGRTDVTFKVIGSGEDESRAPFENNYPEERFYNRTVVIDINKK
jgi:outer membrane protein OmpA-like peptidoglycan-associated protein